MKHPPYQAEQVAAKVSSMRDYVKDFAKSDAQKEKAIQECALEAIEMILRNTQHWIAQV